MISIVIPYYDRQYQLDKTLTSLTESSYNDFNVVIVDDDSLADIILPILPYHVDVIKLGNKTWSNVAPVYNIGFKYALRKNPDIIIIQSPECYHVGDVLSYANKNITDKNYIAFGCFRIDKETTFKEHDIKTLSSTNYCVSSADFKDGDNAWWNHPIYNAIPQYWCAAISTDNLIKLNGIDERFSYGYAREDGYFVHQVKNLGLKIEITDYPFVVHQWHDHIMPDNAEILVRKNADLYEILMKDDNYRSYHILTPNLL